MEKNNKAALSPEDMLERDAGLGSIPELSDREWACFILPELDYEAQLIAISGFLSRNAEAETYTTRQIEELDRTARKTAGPENQQIVDLWCDTLHAATYQDAAHSMAAVGMLAPLFESLFFQAFQGIRKRFYGDKFPNGHRTAISAPDDFWDCHVYYDRKTKQSRKDSLVAGIFQLANAVELRSFLPSDLTKTLPALFAYRNFMFHNGFEWPDFRCQEFMELIEQQQWSLWFSWAKHGNDPWIFYMTDDFVNHCFDLMRRVLEAFGQYCRTRIATCTEVMPIEES